MKDKYKIRRLRIGSIYYPLVYISSAYSGDERRNINSARLYSRFAVSMDKIPVAPHLLFPQFMDDTDDFERKLAMHFNYVLIGKCSEMWIFGEKLSRGMREEYEIAKRRNMKIRWFNTDLEEVKSYEKL